MHQVARYLHNGITVVKCSSENCGHARSDKDKQTVFRIRQIRSANMVRCWVKVHRIRTVYFTTLQGFIIREKSYRRSTPCTCLLVGTHCRSIIPYIST